MIIIGNDVYAITYKDAKNYKLIHTTLINPDWDKAETIAEEKPNQTLESLAIVKIIYFSLIVMVLIAIFININLKQKE